MIVISQYCGRALPVSMDVLSCPWHQLLQVCNGYANCQVFVAWCRYVDAQRCKAARYSQALGIYRRRLLKEGATKWLSVSSDLSQLRMKCATEKGVQVITALLSHGFLLCNF